ncbi:MAG: SH3 domain-containing protein [Candidatus Vecturithrix sp.]|nr:SH3 domain-containing protein [Candidatus Vecturithrix sp.]
MMFRRQIRIVVIIVFIAGMAPIRGLAQNLMSVQVKTAQLRANPSFLGKIITTVSYSKQVDILEKQDAWVKAALPGTSVEGWMHSTALTKKKVLLNPNASDVSQAASNDEIALAGKGFNAEIEKEFRTGNRQVDYESINRMETIVISQQQMETFLQEGSHFPEGGTPRETHVDLFKNNAPISA